MDINKIQEIKRKISTYNTERDKLIGRKDQLEKQRDALKKDFIEHQVTIHDLPVKIKELEKEIAIETAILDEVYEKINGNDSTKKADGAS